MEANGTDKMSVRRREHQQLVDVVRAGEDAVARVLQIGLRRAALYYGCPERHVEYLVTMGIWARKRAFISPPHCAPYSLTEAEMIAGVRDGDGVATARFVGFTGPVMRNVARVLNFGAGGLGNTAKGGC